MSKYVLFEPHGGGLTNIIMSLEMAASVSFITNRILVLPPKFFIDHISSQENKKFFINVWDIFDIEKIKSTFNCIDFFDVPEFQSKFDLISSENSWMGNVKKYIQGVYSVIFDGDTLNDTSTFLTYKKYDDEDFYKFSSYGRRTYLELDIDKKFLFFDQNLFGYYWYRIYLNTPKERNFLKKSINDSFKFNKKLYKESEKIFDLIGNYNSIHVRRNDFLDIRKNEVTSINTPQKLLNVVEFLIPKDLPLYISTDETDLSFFDLLSEKYKIYFYKDLDLTEDKLKCAALEQLICAKSNLFYGCKYSTFSKRINFLRGYDGKQNNDSVFLDYLYPNMDYSNPLPWTIKNIKSEDPVFNWTLPSYPQWTFEKE